MKQTKSKSNSKSKSKGNKDKKGGLSFKSSVTKVMAPISNGYKSKIGDQTGGVSRFRKKEFLMDVNPSSARFKKLRTSDGLVTAIAELAGNVGLTSTFPWLSTIAPGFEQFCFNMCNFLFKPSSATTTQGSMALIPMYDSTREFPKEKTDLLNNTGVSRGPVWAENSCKLDPKKLNSAFKSHKIREGNSDTGEDLKTTDPFKLGVFLDESATNADTTLGELWVDYDVNLSIPKTTSLQRTMVVEYSQVTAGSKPVYSKYGQGSPYVLTITDGGTTWLHTLVFQSVNTKYYLNIQGMGTHINTPGVTVGSYTAILNWGAGGTDSSYMWMLATSDIPDDDKSALTITFSISKTYSGYACIECGWASDDSEPSLSLRSIRKNYAKTLHKLDIAKVLVELKSQKEKEDKTTPY